MHDRCGREEQIQGRVRGKIDGHGNSGNKGRLRVRASGRDDELMSSSSNALRSATSSWMQKRTEKCRVVRTDILAKVCAGQDAHAQVRLHFSDDFDCVIDSEM